MMNRLSLKQKLIGLVLFQILTAVCAGSVSYTGLNKVSAQYEKIASVSFKNSVIIVRLRSEIQNFIRNVVKLSMEGNSSSDLASLKVKIKTAETNFNQIDQELTSDMLSLKDQELHQQLIHTWEIAISEAQKTETLLSSSDPEQHSLGIQSEHHAFDQAYHKLSDAWKALYDSQEADSKLIVAAAQATAAQTHYLSLLVLIIGSGVGLLVGLFTVNNLAKRFIDMGSHLKSEVLSILAASSEASDTGEKLSSGSIQQSASLQTIVSSVH